MSEPIQDMLGHVTLELCEDCRGGIMLFSEMGDLSFTPVYYSPHNGSPSIRYP